MPDLTAPEIEELRSQYLRDKYVAATGSAPAITLSHYNRATKAVFIGDSDLEAIHDRLQVDYAEELKGVYDTKYYERVGEGDIEADAVTQATNEKKQALFRLIRAEVRLMMMEDPGFRGSIADAERSALFTIWKDSIGRDRTFARVRSSARFASLPLERY